MTTKEDLRPATKQLVREITDQLGLNMTSQYDWCFGDPSENCVTFQWYNDICDDGENIYFMDGSSDWAENNRETALTVQINRAYVVSSIFLKVYYTKRPVRVAIVDGTTKVVGMRETSEARVRELDSENWYPHHRDPLTGQIVVLRGVAQSSDFDAYQEDLNDAKNGKKGIVPDSRVVEVTRTTIYQRDSDLVKAVKRRAASGRCEYCGNEGFRTSQGGYYLEAHHVIPLSCRGADAIWNMVAICADDHRRAHFGEDRDKLRDAFILDVLEKIYPERFAQLDEASYKISGDAGLQGALEHGVKPFA